MLKDLIDKLEADVTVFRDFNSVSVELGDLKSALVYLKQLEVLGNLEEMFEELMQLHSEFSPGCHECYTCQQAIPRLRSAITIGHAEL